MEEKLDQQVIQLFLLVRSHGALLSAVIKQLLQKGILDKKQLDSDETEITRLLNEITTADKKDVASISDKLTQLNNFVFKP